MNFIALETEQKLRGGYYTPSDLARFLTRWAAPSAGTRVLEPSCGDGAFFPSLRDAKAIVTAFELAPEEAAKAAARGLPSWTVHDRDFLDWALASRAARFDAVVGNPPFIRYQYLPANFQANAERVFNRSGCRFTKHTNAWVPFVLAAMDLLRPGGRLAMVVPSEIVHVIHAQPLRTYLVRQCRRIVIVDPQEIWFEGTLQGAVLLLAEKKAGSDTPGEGLGIHRVAGRDFMREDPEDVFRAPRAIDGRTLQGKWHYGGGVLELVPSEIEKLLLPAPDRATPDVERLDRMVREDTVADTLEAQSEAVLGTALTKAEQMDLLAAWAALRDRRRLPA